MEHLQDKGVQLLYALEESDTTLEHNFCLLQMGMETEPELEWKSLFMQDNEVARMIPSLQVFLDN